MAVWTPIYKDLKDHPKRKALSRMMGWNTETTIGKLAMFWLWCVDYAEDGDLRKWNDDDIGGASDVPGGTESKKFVQSLKQARWVDTEPYFRVRNWWKYIGPFLQVKYSKKPEKWKAVRDAYAKAELSDGGMTNSRGSNIGNLCGNHPSSNPSNRPGDRPIREDEIRGDKRREDMGGREKAAAPPAAFRQFTDAFCAAWLARYGTKYPFANAKDGVAAKRVMEACEGDPARAIAVVNRYLASDDQFHHGHSLSLLASASQLPKFLSDMQAQKGKPHDTQRHRAPEPRSNHAPIQSFAD